MTYREHLDEFQCQRCLKCCTNPGHIYISHEEVERIAAFLNISEETFLNDHCDLVMKPRLTLKNNPDGSCSMLKGNACSIHEVKPYQCKTFPIKWTTKDAVDYCKGLQLLADKYGK